jgi:serine protease Do
LFVGEVPVGSTVPLKILRNGMIKQVPIVVAPSGEEQLERASLQTEKIFGLKVESLTPQLARELDLQDAHGLVVSSIAPGSTAEASGLRVRDLILEVNRKPVGDLIAYNQAFTGRGNGRIILLLVRRDNGTLFIPLKRDG